MRAANGCPTCGFERSLPHARHELGLPEGEAAFCTCGALITTVCEVGLGHLVSHCAAGCVGHVIDKLTQDCPQCGAMMLIEQAHTRGRYVYRCAANHEHVKIQATCAED